MEIEKSTRHSKILGNFAEYLILYWLSKYGFESALVDHVGIDLIAKNPRTGELMGISVKSRTRTEDKDGEPVNISADNFPKAEAACQAFGCVPYFAVVVDQGQHIHCFLVSLARLNELYPRANGKAWRMSEAAIESYKNDPEVKYFRFSHETHSWW